MSEFWTRNRESEGRRLWREGYSATLIAEKIGTTRNSVIGKASRDGWHRPHGTIQVTARIAKYGKPMPSYNSAPSAYQNGIKSLSVANYHRAAMFFMDSMKHGATHEIRHQSRVKFLAAVAMDVEIRY